MADESEQRKGKGRAATPPQSGEGAGPSSDEDTTLVTRIANSAKGLIQDTAASSARSANQTLSGSLLGDKAASTSGAQHTSNSHGVSRDVQSHNKSSTRQESSAQESFRTSNAENHVETEFAQFSHTGLGGLGIPQQSNRPPLDWNARWGPTPTPTASAASQQRDIQYDDGAEVRALLSDPLFSADGDILDPANFEDASLPPAHELFPQVFSADGQAAADHIRGSLPPAPVFEGVAAENPLNLRPLSDEEKASLTNSVDAFLQSLDQQLIAASSQVAQEDLSGLLSQWNSVLNGYTDEVWGDALPTMQTVDTEMQDLQSGAATLNSKAVARLKMIMGHVQQQVPMPSPNTTFTHQRHRTDPPPVVENSVRLLGSGRGVICTDFGRPLNYQIPILS